MNFSNQMFRLCITASLAVMVSSSAFALDFLEECKARSAGSFLAEVPAQCLFHPSSRKYVYQGIDCFSCKRLSLISTGNSGSNRSGGGGSDSIGGGSTPSDTPSDGSGAGIGSP
ncbi:MAG: hypothetical protein ABJO09_05235 [Hyphomicrobiales bacterium]